MFLQFIMSGFRLKLAWSFVTCQAYWHQWFYRAKTWDRSPWKRLFPLSKNHNNNNNKQKLWLRHTYTDAHRKVGKSSYQKLPLNQNKSPSIFREYVPTVRYIFRGNDVYNKTSEHPWFCSSRCIGQVTQNIMIYIIKKTIFMGSNHL